MPLPLLAQREKYAISRVLQNFGLDNTKIQLRSLTNGAGYYVLTVVVKDEKQMDELKALALNTLNTTLTVVIKTVIHNYNGTGYRKHGEIVVPAA